MRNLQRYAVPSIARWPSRLTARLLLLMEGSLFFRAITWLFAWLGQLCAGSFIVRLFTAHYDETRLENSFYMQWLHRIFDRFPKFLSFPAQGPAALSRWLSGSFIMRAGLHAMETPVPAPYTSAASTKAAALGAVLRWIAALIPDWALWLTLAAVPFLPTMVLAGLLLLVFAATLFRYYFVFDLTAAMLLLFIMVTFFCGYTSLAPRSSIPIALLTSVLMLSYPLILTCFRSQKKIDFLFFIFTLSAAAAGLVGLYQFIIKKVDMTWIDRERFQDIPFRAYSTFDNPNVYGAYLLLAIPLCAALAVYVKHWFYKLCALGITGLLLLNLALTYSRGCYLALGVAALVFVMMIEKRLIIFLSAGIFALPFVLPPTIINRLMSITDFADSSISYRLSIYQASLQILRDFWISGLGQGIDAYNVAYPFYAFHSVSAPHTHNLYLQIFVETGIVGILVFIGVLACFFRTQASFMRRAVFIKHKILSAAMTAAVVGFLFQGIFDYVFYNYRVMLMFFLFIGIAGAVVRLWPQQAAPGTSCGKPDGGAAV